MKSMIWRQTNRMIGRLRGLAVLWVVHFAVREVADADAGLNRYFLAMHLYALCELLMLAAAVQCVALAVEGIRLSRMTARRRNDRVVPE